MKVNIVCSEYSEQNKEWIYARFIKELTKRLDYITVNSNDACDITHFLPYYDFRHVEGPTTAWFSHLETKRRDLHNTFFDVANRVSHSISHSKKYANVLRNNKVNKVSQIMPGIDLDAFTIRQPKHIDKLKVGFIGRSYSSTDRKNTSLIAAISKIPYIDFRATNGKIDFKDIPDFYRDLDLVVSASTIEGGPLAITEALACGVPVLAYSDVGVVDEFNFGVIKARYNDSKDFLNKLNAFNDNDEKNYWSKQENMEKMRNSVENFSWDAFSQRHNEIWNGLY